MADPNLVPGTSREEKHQQHPESDLSNFDKYRKWELFSKYQVWALYDQYGMPRIYCRINQLLKTHNYSGVNVTFLSYNPPQKLNPNNGYKASGSVHACGLFSLSENHQMVTNNLWFSHKVSNAVKGGKSSYHIYPKKGEIWAICKERDSKKTHFDLGSPRIQIYQIVEILADFCKDNGTRVVVLARKRDGFRNLFKWYLKEGTPVSLHVPIDELPRFSHQIPAFRITGGEILSSKYWELDPLSLPRCIDDFASTIEANFDEKYLYRRLLDSKSSVRMDELDLCSNVWAVYDDRDRFPRWYARIDEKSSSTGKFLLTWFGPDPMNGDEKRWYNVGLPIACGSFKAAKSIETDDHLLFSHRVSGRNRRIDGVEYLEIFPKMGDIWAIYKDWDMGWSCDFGRSGREFEYEIVEVVCFCRDHGVLVVYLGKIDGFESVFRRKEIDGQEVQFEIPMNEFLRFSHQIPAYIVNDEHGADGIEKGSWILDLSALPFEFRGKMGDSTIVGTTRYERGLKMDGIAKKFKPEDTVMKKRSTCCSSEYSEKNSQQNKNPRREEHKLDDDKSKKSFMVDQIWASYDNIDRMPRCYARVRKIIRGGYLEVIMLEPHPINEDEMKWIEESLPMVCGTFKASNSTIIKELSEFSHQVSCDGKSKLRNFYNIFPHKGEIWAVYKDWSVGWNESDFMKQHQYRMVEIISDFGSEAGVSVAWLIKLEGWVDILERQMHQGMQLVQQFSRSEFLRFSHQVPAFKFMRDEGEAWKLCCSTETPRQIGVSASARS